MTESKRPAASADGTGGAMLASDRPAAFSLPEPPKYLTPDNWAIELGNVDPVVVRTPRNPAGAVNAEECRGWIHAATKVHAGWGTRLADDMLLTRDQYEQAVNAALNVPLTEARTATLLARIDAAKPKEKV